MTVGNAGIGRVIVVFISSQLSGHVCHAKGMVLVLVGGEGGWKGSRCSVEVLDVASLEEVKAIADEVTGASFVGVRPGGKDEGVQDEVK